MSEDHRAIRSPGLIAVFRARGWALCSVGVVYQALLLLVVGPISAGAWSFAVARASGSSAVVNSALTRLVTTPVSVLALALAALAAISVERVAVAATAAVVVNPEQGAWDALTGADKHLGELLRIALWQFWLLLLYSLPALALAGGAYLIAFGPRGPVSAYARNPNGLYWIGGVLGVVLVSMWVYLALRWVFSVQAFVEQGYRGRAALRRSRELTAGRWVRIGGSIAALVLGLMLAGVVVSLVSRLAVMSASGSVGWLAVWLAVNSMLSAALAVLIFSALQALVMSRYLRARSRSIAPSSAERAGRAPWTAIGLIVLAAATVGALGVLVVSVTLGGPIAPTQIELIAHRAGEAYAPENTVAAVEQARKDNADRLEFDVQRTSDGQLVVVHDADLLRLSGKDISVGGSTLAEVQAVDIGKGQHVPTLIEFLDAAGDTPLALEIKTHPGDKQSTEEVVTLLQARGAIDRTVLLSLDPAITDLAHRKEPRLRTADLVSVAIGQVPLLPSDVIAPTSSMASTLFVSAAHSAGRKVWVWSLTDDAMVREAAMRGVDGIITSDVPRTREVLAEMGALSAEEVRARRVSDLLDALAN
ncbi:MAG: hypothetical protein HGB10_02345 [Coriobacteriia bacterium]|nr:hypothetical protein [Coriobacteriia bacterium]